MCTWDIICPTYKSITALLFRPLNTWWDKFETKIGRHLFYRNDTKFQLFLLNLPVLTENNSF